MCKGCYKFFLGFICMQCCFNNLTKKVHSQTNQQEDVVPYAVILVVVLGVSQLRK